MPVTQDIKDRLRSNCTFVGQLLKLTAKDGAIAAWNSTSRFMTIAGQLYTPASPIDISEITSKEGVDAPDSGEIIGVLDDIVTKVDLLGGRWVGARIYTAWIVDIRDPSLGLVQEKNGFMGKATPRGSQFTAEYLSLSHALQQTIGADTSPTDRRRTLAETGINLAPHTHARTVASFTDRQVFTVNGAAQADQYFQYGLASFTSGANSGLSMEIKSNVGNVITLIKPMRSAIANGDAVTLVRGYDGTRAQAKLIDPNLVIGMDAEPDLKGMDAVITYPA